MEPKGRGIIIVTAWSMRMANKNASLFFSFILPLYHLHPFASAGAFHRDLFFYTAISRLSKPCVLLVGIPQAGIFRGSIAIPWNDFRGEQPLLIDDGYLRNIKLKWCNEMANKVDSGETTF